MPRQAVIPLGGRVTNRFARVLAAGRRRAAPPPWGLDSSKQEHTFAKRGMCTPERTSWLKRGQSLHGQPEPAGEQFSRPGPLGDLGPVPDRGEGQLDGVGPSINAVA
jgi:hypothetical protein